MTEANNITPFPGVQGAGAAAQRDAIVRDFHQVRRQSVPLAAQQFDIVHRLIGIHEITAGRLLDLGAGDGFAAAMILERHPVERIVLVDSSSTALDEARNLFRNAPLPVEYIEGDLATEEWWDEAARSGPYDLVIARYAIHTIADDRKQALYRRILDFLTPGGLFVNMERVASPTPRLAEVFSRLMIEGIVRTQATPDTKVEIETARASAEAVAGTTRASAESQLQWLRDAGFSDVDVVFKLFELAIITGRKPER